MASLYSPASDPLAAGLSSAAQALDSARLESEVLVAELVLELTGTTLTGDDATRATALVARQVNLQVRIASSGDVVAESRGNQSYTYAQVDGRRVAIDPVALRGVRNLTQRRPRTSAVDGVVRW